MAANVAFLFGSFVKLHECWCLLEKIIGKAAIEIIILHGFLWFQLV